MLIICTVFSSLLLHCHCTVTAFVLIVLSDIVAEQVLGAGRLARSCDDVTIGHMDVGLAELAPVHC